MRRSLLLAAMWMGCTSHRAPTERTVTPSSVSRVEKAVSVLDPPVPLAAHLGALGAVLARDEGIVFAAGPADSVFVQLVGEESWEHPDGGAGISLRDGQRVTFVEDNVAAGEGIGQTFARIKVDGRTALIPNANLVTGERLARSADGALAVFAPVSACGDACYHRLWILSARGRRLLAEQVAEQPVLLPQAWAGRYVVGTDSIYLVSVDLETKPVPGCYGPALAMDGTLFVRDVESDAIFTLGADGKRRLFFDLKRPRDPREEGDYDSGYEPAVRFERADQIVLVQFHRWKRMIELRLDRAGKPIAKSGRAR